jgi:hypothetical protein
MVSSIDDIPCCRPLHKISKTPFITIACYDNLDLILM